MMNSYRLKLTLLLILVTSLVGLLISVAAAQESVPSPQDSQDTVSWSDDFESYPVDPWPQFPDPPWNNSGHNDAFVYNDQYVSGAKSLKLIGIFGPGECGGSIAYRPIGGVAPVDIQVWVRTGDQDLSGCHQKYATIEIATGQDWMYPDRGLIAFTEDGQILGGDWEIGSPPGMFLGTYTKEVWYKVNIHYEVLNSSTVRLTYSINNGPQATLDAPIKGHEAQLTQIGLWGAEGVAWYDDITVTANEGPPPPPVNDVYIPFIQR